MSILIDNNHLQEAIEAGLERAEIIRRMSLLQGPPPGYIDQQYGYLYSKMAYLFLQVRQPQKPRKPTATTLPPTMQNPPGDKAKPSPT